MYLVPKYFGTEMKKKLMLTQKAYDAPTTGVQCPSLQSEAKTYENTRFIAWRAF